MAQPVQMERLDQGRTGEKGDFRCTECEWEGLGTWDSVARGHARRQHEGRRAHISSVRGKARAKQPDEQDVPERLRRKRETDRRYWARKQVSGCLGCVVGRLLSAAPLIA